MRTEKKRGRFRAGASVSDVPWHAMMHQVGLPAMAELHFRSDFGVHRARLILEFLDLIDGVHVISQCRCFWTFWIFSAVSGLRG